MLSFIEYLNEELLNEIGDYKPNFSYRLHKNTPVGDIHDYKFNVNGQDYGVDISHGPKSKSASVVFGDDQESIDISGQQGSSASKVLSSVHNIIKHHAENNPLVSEYTFSAPIEEPSRVKLYQKYSKLQNGTWKSNRKYTTFHIPANSYRSISESDEGPIRIKLGKPSGISAQKFIDEFERDSDEHPFNHSARILHGAVVHISKDGSQVHLHDIQSLAPKSGAGTKALTHLTNLADKHGVKLNLFAKAYAKQPQYINSTPRLIKWYEKHGFKHDEPDFDVDYGSDMTYYPK